MPLGSKSLTSARTGVTGSSWLSDDSNMFKLQGRGGHGARPWPKKSQAWRSYAWLCKTSAVSELWHTQTHIKKRQNNLKQIWLLESSWFSGLNSGGCPFSNSEACCFQMLRRFDVSLLSLTLSIDGWIWISYGFIGCIRSTPSVQRRRSWGRGCWSAAYWAQELHWPKRAQNDRTSKQRYSHNADWKNETAT